jgi:hypothetical protein
MAMRSGHVPRIRNTKPVKEFGPKIDGNRQIGRSWRDEDFIKMNI